MVEFAEDRPEFGLVGIVVSNADGCEAVENAELLFAESLVDEERITVGGHSGCLDDEAGGVSCAKIRGGEHDGWTLFQRQRANPAPQRDCLTLPELRKRDIDVA